MIVLNPLSEVKRERLLCCASIFTPGCFYDIEKYSGIEIAPSILVKPETVHTVSHGRCSPQATRTL